MIFNALHCMSGGIIIERLNERDRKRVANVIKKSNEYAIVKRIKNVKISKSNAPNILWLMI